MTTLMRSTQGVWFGNDFVPAGTVLPAGHPRAAHPAFVVYEVEDAPDEEAEIAALRLVAEKAGVKVDGRWKADRLREEIALAGG